MSYLSKIGIVTSILLIFGTTTSYTLSNALAQPQDLQNTNQTSPQRLSELVTPHLTALSDALDAGNITQALDQSRLIEAQLYVSTLNSTTTAVGNATGGQGQEDYSYYNVFGQWCFVDEYYVGFTLFANSYCY